MREQLAGRLLNELLEWSDEEQAEWMQKLHRLAHYKYNDYERFAPGERFFESLARWLAQFPAVERRRLIEFILDSLIFISRDELSHAISCAYPDFIKTRLVSDVAEELGIEPYRVTQVIRSSLFQSLRRQTLYLGLSDGARLDRLRRNNPELSHEQFWLSTSMDADTRQGMLGELENAFQQRDYVGNPIFKRIVFVDDFYGSGTSLLDRREDGSWKGKLQRANGHMDKLMEENVLDPQSTVDVLVYIASEQARSHIEEMLQVFAPGWQLHVIQPIPDSYAQESEEVADLCHWYWDPCLEDEHKGSATMGYMEAKLPLVLHHNTPNNSICILWADSTDDPNSKERRALFPRYERHHEARP